MSDLHDVDAGVYCCAVERLGCDDGVTASNGPSACVGMTDHS